MHQLKNGYTRIANSLLHELYNHSVSMNTLRIMLWAIRNSYGYNRKKTEFKTLAKISAEVGMSRSSVHLAIGILLKSGVLTKNSAGEYFFNKNKVSKINAFVQPTGQQVLSSPLDKTVQPTGQIVQPTGQQYIRYKDNLKKERKGRCAPATLPEIEFYCKETGITVDFKKFYYHYESTGWMTGKTQIKDWKAMLKKWECSEKSEDRKEASNAILDEIAERRRQQALEEQQAAREADKAAGKDNGRFE